MEEKAPDPEEPKRSSGWMILRASLFLYGLPVVVVLLLKWLLGW